MTKQEILQLIEETIVPNKQKGITASTLSNVLIEMLSASGAGSGDGALRIRYSPEFGMEIPADDEFTEMGLDEEAIQKVKEYFTMACAENAAAYQKIKENLAQYKGTFVILDSDLDSAMLDILKKWFEDTLNETYGPAYGIQVDFTPFKAKMAAAIPAVVLAREVDYSGLDEVLAEFAKDLTGFPEGDAILIYSIFDDVVNGDTNLGLKAYELHSDGSVTLDTSTPRQEFTIPGNIALLESDLQNNKYWYGASNIIGKTFELLTRNSDMSRTIQAEIVILSYTHISGRLAYLFLQEATIKALQLDDQGNITITDYISLTPITQ